MNLEPNRTSGHRSHVEPSRFGKADRDASSAFPRDQVHGNGIQSAGREGSRVGFSFIEILIGVSILATGLVPLVLAYTMSTRGTRVSINQVKAIQHTSNLLEAIRAYGIQDYKNIEGFPTGMTQRKGENKDWVALDTPLEDGDGVPPVNGDATGESWKKFLTDFFDASEPIIPPLGRAFKRSFQIIRGIEPGYSTIIVRTSWDQVDITSEEGVEDRNVELRTVVANPFNFINSRSAGDDQPTAGVNGAASPNGSPAGRSSAPVGVRTPQVGVGN